MKLALLAGFATLAGCGSPAANNHHVDRLGVTNEVSRPPIDWQEPIANNPDLRPAEAPKN